MRSTPSGLSPDVPAPKSKAGGPIDAHAEMNPSKLAVDAVAEQLVEVLGVDA